MSDLYDVSVATVTDKYVELDVTVVHPDAGGVSEGLCFALSLLADPLDEYVCGREEHVRNSPLFDEIDLDSYLSEEFIRSNARGFVASSKIVESENHPPPYWGDDNYDSFWQGDESSWARLRITPTHPGWIAHLREGMSWDTAAYDCGNPLPWDRPTRYPGDKVKQVTDDPMQGMRSETKNPNNSSMLSDATVKEFILPNEGSKSYTVKEKLEGDAITPAAIKALLGEPVLVQGSGGRLEIGALVRADDEGSFTIYSARDGSQSSRGFSPSSVDWMGRAYFLETFWVDELDV